MDTHRPSSPHNWRDILIAINAVLRGNRDFRCKLAANPGAWIGLHPSAIRGAAQRLGVTVSSLRQASALLPRAGEIAEREVAGCAKLGARIITRFEPDYPTSLLDLALPPPVLYCRGHLDSRPAVAIVGSRRSDPYGLEVSRLFACELGRQGLTIVSGLALGIDAAAHRGALEAGAPTVAVLGCGIDVDYPRRNRDLCSEIASDGAVVSEFSLGAAPESWRFPVRNRIIAALAAGTLVVRATPNSGSLITARHALDLGRDVFSIPGEIFDQRSIGTNSLIRDGAYPVQHPREILESLPLSAQLRLRSGNGAPAAIATVPDGLAEHLMKLLARLPVGKAVSEENLLSFSGLSVEQTLSALFELEMLGCVERRPGPRFVRSVGELPDPPQP